MVKFCKFLYKNLNFEPKMALYSNIQIIFDPKNLTEYRIEYDYLVPNYSNIRSNTEIDPIYCHLIKHALHGVSEKALNCLVILEFWNISLHIFHARS